MQVSLNSRDENTNVFWYMHAVCLLALDNTPQETVVHGSIFVIGRGDVLRPSARRITSVRRIMMV